MNHLLATILLTILLSLSFALSSCGDWPRYSPSHCSGVARGAADPVWTCYGDHP